MKLSRQQSALLRDLVVGGGRLYLEFMSTGQRRTAEWLTTAGLATIAGGYISATDYGRAVLEHKS